MDFLEDGVVPKGAMVITEGHGMKLAQQTTAEYPMVSLEFSNELGRLFSKYGYTDDDSPEERARKMPPVDLLVMMGVHMGFVAGNVLCDDMPKEAVMHAVGLMVSVITDNALKAYDWEAPTASYSSSIN
jgi:hypothetical protein